MVKQTATLLFVFCISIGLTAKADSGVPGLGEAMVLAGSIFIICFLIAVFMVAIITRYLLNAVTKKTRKKLWIICAGSFSFGAAAVFIHGIGDLTFRISAILLIVLCSFLGGTIGYFLTKRE